MRPVRPGSLLNSRTLIGADLADAFLKSASPFLVVKSESGTTAGIVPLSEFVELIFGFELGPPAQNAGNDINLLRGYEL